MKDTALPSGWDEQSLQELVDYYERQTGEEAAAEHEAALSEPPATLMEVPADLVPLFRELIARRRRSRSSPG
jgi:hypothetical protein